jgi:8-oxo-dGTP diphosphatase / 2-hydroxy-dATP diphosphatase
VEKLWFTKYKRASGKNGRKGMKKVMTVCYVRDGERILLGLKKRRLGKGFWNGFGGRVEKGETIEEAAIREVKEEAGIDVRELRKVGVLEFESEAREAETLEVHFFTTTEFTGKPVETHEMRPQWFHVDAIPYAEMWSSDPYWFPLMLESKKFKGRFSFSEDDTVLDYKLEEVENI